MELEEGLSGNGPADEFFSDPGRFSKLSNACSCICYERVYVDRRSPPTF